MRNAANANSVIIVALGLILPLVGRPGTQTQSQQDPIAVVPILFAHTERVGAESNGFETVDALQNHNRHLKSPPLGENRYILRVALPAARPSDEDFEKLTLRIADSSPGKCAPHL